MSTQLSVIVKNSGLEMAEGKTLLEKFGNYEQIANEWEIKAKQIVVTDASQTTEMAMAKAARKKFSDLRIDVEKSRVAMKEQSLRKGQAIDAIARFLVSLIKPIEDHLKLQEDFVKIQEAKKAEELRLELQRKEEEKERLRLEAEAKEQERIRLENIRLQKEAKKREEEFEKERAKAEQERQKAEDERLEKERMQKILDAQIECPYCHKKFTNQPKE